ncbi:SprT-like [uncultured Caudovirales phage]|uniref:SprT-like n=1 Tax=uncultured Caudovirales phage TaxID=2100421 RepID=A0A6J5LIV1_9CAUD|nr:SprT-like [uncultured Caudovirales phage]
MFNPSQLINACCDLLAVKKPVEIRLRTHARKSEKGLAGFCEPRFRNKKITGYVIVVNLITVVESDYSLADVIAHEICHCAQFEHGIFDENHHHDKRFQMLCKILEKNLKKLGYPVGKLYNKKVDTD